MSSPARIRVLVVDDSAFARKVVREVLAADDGIDVVGIARDGLEALEKIQQLAPDVVTLDLVMPGLDGLGVLDVLRDRPGPRIVVVSTAPEDGDLAIRALQAGAVDMVQKPTAIATDRLYELSNELVAKVKIAAQARLDRPPPSSPRAPAPAPRGSSSAVRVIALGASTGGPQALTRILPDLPADLPVPMLIALHMPVGYTASLAQRLDGISALSVVEAHDGMALQPGRAILARAGVHLKVVGHGDGVRVKLDAAPIDAPHRPSIDVLLSSAAQCYGAGTLGVVLTGMGQDGLEGARAIRARGGAMLTEDESTCVVYGMPRAIAEAGLSDRVVTLDHVGEILKLMV